MPNDATSAEQAVRLDEAESNGRNDTQQSENQQDDDQQTENQQGGDSQSGNQTDDESQEGTAGNVLEWIVGAIGALIVLMTIGFISYKIIAGVGSPPDLRVTLGTPADKGNEMIVPVEVENEGGSVAADAVIEVCAGTDECAQITFNYVPHESTRKGNVGFGKPLTGPLTTRVVSYREP